MMFQGRNIVMLIIAILVANAVHCQESKPGKRISVLPLPAIGYSPETRTYIGAVTFLPLTTGTIQPRALRMQVLNLIIPGTNK